MALKRLQDSVGRLRAWMLEASSSTARRITLTMFLMLAAFDFLSPRYITFGTFYLVLIAYASWVLDRRSGWIVAIAAIAASVGINGFGAYAIVTQGSERELAIAWNLLMRVLSSGAVVELVRSFRTSFDQERRLGEIDPLTGILNRRSFHATASARLASALADGRAGVIAYIDLNGFKPINDRYGHSAGDEVLVRFSEMLSCTVRACDCVGRSGGDEFVLFLDVPSVSVAQRAVLGLRRRLEEGLATLPYEGLSCSMGAVIVPAGSHPPLIESLLTRADHLMYEAKAGNFMRVELSDAPDAGSSVTPINPRSGPARPRSPAVFDR